MNPFRSFATGLVIVLGLFFFAQGTQAATTTVCTIGCDYTTLYDAVSADLPGPDGFEILTGYVFDQGLEGGGNVTLPEESFLTCDPGTTLGNGEGSLILNSNSTTTVDSCHFDGVTLRAENAQNVIWNNNTFTTPNRSEFHLFDVTNYQITNNEDFSHIRLYNADGGVFENNDFACQGSSDFSLGCLHSTFVGYVPYNGSATTTDPIFNSNNLVITGNTFNSPTDDFYGYIDFFGGTDISITNNSFLRESDVPNGFLGVRFQDPINVEIINNVFDIYLSSSSGSGGSSAINFLSENQLEVSAEHNTVIFRGVSTEYNYCYRIERSTALINPADLVRIAYNICTATEDDIQTGLLVDDTVMADIPFTEEYNAFYPIDIAALYINGVGATSTNITTHDDIKPIFRTENTDPNDDYELNPASALLDVNGSTDIGRYPGSRVSTYTVDDDCTVDYVACFSHFSENIEHFLRDSDSVLIAEGTYGTLGSHRALNNVSIVGAGPLTILDAQSTATGINLSNADAFEVRDIKIINVNSTGGATYTGTHVIFAYNGNDYDDSDLIMGTPNLNLHFNETSGCVAGTTAADGDPYFIGDGTNNIHGVLIDLGGVYISGLTTSTAPTVCGSAPIEVRVDDLFIANSDGTYSYNPTALTTAGVTLKAGITTPPAIQAQLTTDLASGALRLDAVMNSVFRNLVFENNDTGITIVGGSDNNEIHDSDLSLNNSAIDFGIDNSGDNAVFHSVFAVTKTAFTGSGTLAAWFENTIRVVDALALPLPGITVHKVSANGLEDTTEVTDASGLTSATDTLAFVLDSSNFTATGGGYNPYALTADRSGQNDTTTINATITEAGIVELMMNTVPVTPVNPGGGIGGLTTVNNDGSYPPIESIRSTEVITTPKVHYLIKLVDDNDPATQEDSSIYYIAADGKRHIFPNESVYRSWYCDFSEVKAMSAEDLAKYDIGSNVTYRPGLRMLKFVASPVVYMIQSGRTLRPIYDEATAAKFFGKNWAKQITDVEETFYKDYTIGEMLYDYVDPQHLDYAPKHPSGEMGIKNYKNIFVQPASLDCR